MNPAINKSQKTVLVTGATNGIGKVTALELAKMGYRVLLTSRDTIKGQKVLEEIQTQSGNHSLELFVGDLSSMADVRRISLEVSALHPKLDVLVNNAGGIFTERQNTVDGFEYTLAFNHLSYFLLTVSLLPILKAAENARIVSVSSGANLMAQMHWEDLEFKTGYKDFLVYNQSKLMNVLFANGLARRLTGSGVTSNSLHPGIVRSGFGEQMSGFNKFLLNTFKLFSVTPERGAQTSLYLATSSEVEGVTGGYFDKKKQRRANPIAYDEAAQDRLWNWSEKLVSPWLNVTGR
jgi:NAD(P)-dependent dehydrogenase (short-subunit alcohol dehydrogenase family)